MRVTGKSLLVSAMLGGMCLYVINSAVTPLLVSARTLEPVFRPRIGAPFDASKWKAASFDSGEKFAMVDTLPKRLRGKQRAQVVTLVGEPDCAYKRDSVEVLIYHLASQRQFPAKSWLFPWAFPNAEAWALQLKLKEGVVVASRITIS